MKRYTGAHQRGMTTLGMLLTLGVLIAVITVGIKLVPVYLESFTVTSVLKSLGQDPEIASSSDGQIRESVAKRFDINDVEHARARDIQISRSSGRVQRVGLSYEVRVPIVGNIDAMVHFDDSVEVRH